MKEKTLLALVSFYGIKCLAYIYEDSFELIGKTRIGQWFLDIYVLVILAIINFITWFCYLFVIKYEPDFKLKVFKYITEEEYNNAFKDISRE